MVTLEKSRFTSVFNTFYFLKISVKLYRLRKLNGNSKQLYEQILTSGTYEGKLKRLDFCESYFLKNLNANSKRH